MRARRPSDNLACVDIANKGDAPETVLADVKGFELSLDRKKLLVSKGEDFYILDSDAKAAALGDAKALAKARMDLSRWTFDTNPRAEFHELFLDAWRLERDYFYDRNMQGVDWNQMRDRYLPLVDRVADRDDLNDVHCADGQRAFRASHLRPRRRCPRARRTRWRLLPSGPS